MEPGMDFHKAFEAIDTDHSGEITVEELEIYCKKMNYKDTFVKKWLNLFDEDQSGTITYEEFCNTLGLVPKQEVVEKHREYQAQQAMPGPSRPKKAATKKSGRSRNSALTGTLMMYSRARMFKRKALYRLDKKLARGRTGDTAKAASSAKVTLKVKEIGGEKNGGKRLVPSRRSPGSLPTSVSRRKNALRPKSCFKDHKRRLRASITPGTVLILLAGRHRGKRVVYLKQLTSGLLLVTGPLRLNGCPLRRVAQSFVVATKTRIDTSAVKLPERVNDQYFRRLKQVKKSSTGAQLFAQEKLTYQLTQERKEDQKSIDSQVMAAIHGSDDQKMLCAYMRSLFRLKNGDKPHNMVF